MLRQSLHHVLRLAGLALSLVMCLMPRAGEGKRGGPRAEAVQDEGGGRPLRNYRPRPGTTRRGSPQTGQRWRAVCGCRHGLHLWDVPQGVKGETRMDIILGLVVLLVPLLVVLTVLASLGWLVL